jgi:molybdopterin-guanine dinucleotide biosynthesis protein A
MRATLLLLAGGESRRMGRPKALLEVGDETLIEFVCRRLRDGFDEILVSTNQPGALPAALGARAVPDRLPGAGPLAGIEAGLAAARHEVVFTIACDMPYVDLPLARNLVRASRGFDAAVPRVDGRPEPVCAAYRLRSLPALTKALDDGIRKAAEALDRLHTCWWDGVDPDALRSVNTRDDWARFVATHSRSGP